ncbi:MAG: hypothetical protein AB7O57_08375 [Hyphomicrobiaceae bacterium]
MPTYTVKKAWFMPVQIDVEVEVPDGATAEQIIEAADKKLCDDGYDGLENIWDGVTDEWVESIEPSGGAPKVKIPASQTEEVVIAGMYNAVLPAPAPAPMKAASDA